jgi:hypothetical protein
LIWNYLWVGKYFLFKKKKKSIDKNKQTTKPFFFTDVPAWLRSLRLHKYNTIFSDTNWQTIIVMNDADLIAKGVAALGARRKMLKVFENVRAHCDANVSPKLLFFTFFF